MTEIVDFGEIVLVVAAGVSLALLSTKVTQRVPIPAPAIFFFDGGMKVGWRRARQVAAPIALLGVVGTFATAGLMAVFAHAFFDFNWTLAWILGAALAPTDPAVMFSILGNREVGGRSGTILEGESGGNDPVAIALVVGTLEFATHEGSSVWGIVQEVTVEMAVGLAIGVAGAAALLQLMRRVSLPSESLYAVRTLVAAAVIYGAASLVHGSGFLAVFIAGLLIGDARAPFKREIERFQDALASLAEITVFAALGLTFHFADLTKERIWLDGILLAVLLGLIARPFVVYTLLAPIRMRWAERTFIAWTGLKGAVPILLSTFALVAGLDGGRRIYHIVVVVVIFSVVVQGSSVLFAARRLGIPMRTRELEPYSLYVGLQEEPEGVVRYRVAPKTHAANRRVRDLSIGDSTWISLIVREGVPIQPRGSSKIRVGDEVLVLTDPADEPAVRRVFEG